MALVRSLCHQAVAFAAMLALGAVARADTTINGSALAFRSSGTASGPTVTLNQNGYLGTYVRLDAPGAITLSANAGGAASNGVNPSLTFSIADAARSFSVTPGGTNAYAYTSPVMPAGTYFVRAQLDNHKAVRVNGATVVADTTLALSSLSVGGNATVLNTANDANALAAADTYIKGFRKGDASVRLNGVAPGTAVRVQLKNNAFKLGSYVSGGYSSTDSFLRANPPAGSTAANFQKFIAGRFNSIVPSNAGKWDPNASLNGAGVSTQKIGMGINDQMMAYARANGMAARQHNLIWGAQQPEQVKTWLKNAADTTLTPAVRAQNVASLKAAIADRVAYYIKGANGVTGKARATHYRDLDVLNEAMLTGSYWHVLGASGVADVYRQAQVAAAEAGADVRTFVNEYNVLQYSPSTVVPSPNYETGATVTYGDPYGLYANWYRQEVEAINNAGLANGAPGNVVIGIGVQYYPTSGGQLGPGVIQKAMQNLAVAGLPMALTEFGGSEAITPEQAPGIVDDAIRMMLGTHGVESMHVWGWYDNGQANPFGGGTAFVNPGWTNADGSNPNPWTTDLLASVAADGTIRFNGFYGDYELLINGKTYALTLEKGVPTYVPQVPEPATLATGAAALFGIALRRRSRAQDKPASK